MNAPRRVTATILIVTAAVLGDPDTLASSGALEDLEVSL